MADSKITQLTANTTPLSTDIMPMVDDPAGTPLTQKIAISDLMALFKNPVSNDGASLGTTAIQWSDLFLATGAVINYNNGNVSITHAANSLTVAGGVVILAAGTTTYPPLKLQVGTLETTAEDGAVEMDADCMYGCTDAGNRGVIGIEHFVCLSGSYTLTSNTNVQKLFNATANGTLTLEPGTYMFECLISLSSMSATSGNAAFSLAGTATLGTILMFCDGVDGATATAAAGSNSMAITAAFPASMVTAGVGTALQAYIKGTFRVTVAGTIIPSIQLVTAAAAVVAAGSFFRCRRVGSASVTNVGQWS
jgi:hypothetical protein